MIYLVPIIIFALSLAVDTFIEVAAEMSSIDDGRQRCGRGGSADRHHPGRRGRHAAGGCDAAGGIACGFAARRDRDLTGSHGQGTSNAPVIHRSRPLLSGRLMSFLPPCG